jgi:hypothetical protein
MRRESTLSHMAEGRATATLPCTADEYLAFVLDVERYREVDDKLGRIDWVRTEGNVTEFRFRPKMPLMPWSPKVVSRMTLTPGQRVDIAYAPRPQNRLAHVLSSFSAFFSCEPVESGTLVTRSVTIALPVLLRPIERLTLDRSLQRSVERELALTRDVLARSH